MYRGWEEPLAQGPAGVHLHEDRPLLGKKIKGNRRVSCMLSACGWTKRSDR